MTFILLVFLVLLYLISNKKDYRKYAKRYIYLITFVLIILSGLRHEAVGNDTYAYIKQYEEVSSFSWNDVFDNFLVKYITPSSEGKDPGIFVLFKLLNVLHFSSRALLFIVASLLLIPLGILVYKKSNNLKTIMFFYCFYVILFYGYLPNSAIRQTIALSFVLWGYISLMGNKRIGFICLIIIASLFHKSALICLIIIPLLSFKNTKLIYKISIIPFILVLIFPNIIGHILIQDNEIYSAYTTGGYYTQQNKPYTIILLIILLYCIGWLKLRYDQNKDNLLYYGSAMTFILVPLIWIDPSALRIISYFAPCMGITVGNALSQIRYKHFIFLMLILFFFYNSMSRFNEYRFMWQEMELHERYT